MSPSTSRLPRAERSEQILVAATGLLARDDPARVTTQDVAAAAGVTRAIVYRHFSDRDEVHRAAHERAGRVLAAAVGPPPWDADVVGRLVRAAHTAPDAFRLLLVRPPAPGTLGRVAGQSRAEWLAAAREALGADDADGAWGRWTARIALDVTVTAIDAWLDEGAPDPDLAIGRITDVVGSAVRAARG